MYIIWNEMCQSIYSGEDDGWTSYEAALSACCDGADMPAFHAEGKALVFGRANCARAEAALVRADAQDATDRARRATTLASFGAAQVVAKPDRATTLAKILASNVSALAACKRTDRVEITRLQQNCAKLRAEIGA